MPRGELGNRLFDLVDPALDVEADLVVVRTRARRRRRRVGAATAIVVLIIVLLSAGLLAARTSDEADRNITAEPSPTSSTVLPRHIPKVPASATTRFSLPPDASGPLLAVGDGSVWVASRSTQPDCHVTCGGVARINPKTGRVLTTISIPKAPRALAFGEGALWAEVEVPDNSPALVIKVDPVTGQVVAQADVPGISVVGSTGHPRLAIGAGAIWLQYGVELVKIDPATAGVVGSMRYESDHDGIVANDLGVWLVNPNIESVDPMTLATHEVARLPLGFVQTAGVDGDTIWLTEAHGSDPPRRTVTIELIEVDTQTGEADFTGIPTAFVAVGGGRVWCQTTDALIEIDPRRVRAVQQAPVGADQSTETTAVVEPTTVWLVRGQQLIRIRA